MNEKNLDKNLVIYFKISESDHYAASPQPSLFFKSSNYDLSREEIMRASLRPTSLTLDNKMIYTKSNENAYLNANEESILKINYCKLNQKS